MHVRFNTLYTWEHVHMCAQTRSLSHLLLQIAGPMRAEVKLVVTTSATVEAVTVAPTSATTRRGNTIRFKWMMKWMYIIIYIYSMKMWFGGALVKHVCFGFVSRAISHLLSFSQVVQTCLLTLHFVAHAKYESKREITECAVPYFIFPYIYIFHSTTTGCMLLTKTETNWFNTRASLWAFGREWGAGRSRDLFSAHFIFQYMDAFNFKHISFQMLPLILIAILKAKSLQTIRNWS